jgi:hypothetical protein
VVRRALLAGGAALAGATIAGGPRLTGCGRAEAEPRFDFGDKTADPQAFATAAGDLEDLSLAALQRPGDEREPRHPRRGGEDRLGGGPPRRLDPERRGSAAGAGRRSRRVWVEARLPVLPNGTTGWLPRAALGGYRLVRTHLVVNRRAATATLRGDGRRVFRARVGVALRRWPTPRGRFYIRNKLVRCRSRFYGPGAFGTGRQSSTTGRTEASSACTGRIVPISYRDASPTAVSGCGTETSSASAA